MSAVPSLDRTLRVLEQGELTLQGLVPWSSNYTFVVSARLEDEEVAAIYKPRDGERPLWDFDAGTLCLREVAAYRVSTCLGWPSIPPVVLREGPHGWGSVQLLVEHDQRAHYFVLRDRPALIPGLRRIALFDYVANNADRKGGHVLLGEDDTLWAIDHGLTFHTEYKLRTVIWDWAGTTVPRPWLRDLEHLRDELSPSRGSLRQELEDLLAEDEIDALAQRTERALRERALPQPRNSMRNVPYPLV
jgi:uncharacterized repeat protein (TIGR03843 family)